MSSTEPNPPSPHVQPQPAAQTRCWFTFLHFRCMTCAHRMQVNESPVMLSTIVISTLKKHRPLIGRRQNVHRNVWDFASGDRGSPGVLIPRRYSLQSFPWSLIELSNSALCFRSCQRNRSSAYALTCITICSRHPVDATLLDACNFTSSVRLGIYVCPVVSHLLVSRTAMATTCFLLFRGFSTFSVDGGSESAGRRVPITDRLR
jgi:hypothetical protein